MGGDHMFSKVYDLPPVYSAMYEKMDPMQLLMMYGVLERAFSDACMQAVNQHGNKTVYDRELAVAGELRLECMAVYDLLMFRLKPISSGSEYISRCYQALIEDTPS
jgi:hypothetical protein